MKNTKKIVAMALAIVMLLVMMAGCGKKEPELIASDPTEAEPTVKITAEPTEPKPTEAPKPTTPTTKPTTPATKPTDPPKPTTPAPKPTTPATKPTEPKPTQPPKPTEPKPTTLPTTETTVPHQHSYKSEVVKPDCITDGYTKHTCSCGDSYTDTKVLKLGHDIYESKVVQPTYEEGGYTVYSCKRCDFSYEGSPTPPLSAPEATTQPTEPPTVPPTVPPTEPPATEPYYPPVIEEDYGTCPDCGRKFWTSTNPTGCFSYLVDTVCDCGVLVHAMECHHH